MHYLINGPKTFKVKSSRPVNAAAELEILLRSDDIERVLTPKERSEVRRLRDQCIALAKVIGKRADTLIPSAVAVVREIEGNSNPD